MSFKVPNASDIEEYLCREYFLNYLPIELLYPYSKLIFTILGYISIRRTEKEKKKALTRYEICKNDALKRFDYKIVP